MKGLDICKSFYLEHGAPMLKNTFPEIEDLIAVGLVGSGSECLGFDDETSHDHDLEAGFCLFLPDEDVIDRRTAFLLERAYAKLPREYMGLTRNALAPVGGNRRGVIRIADFLEEHLGVRNGTLSTRDWFTLSEQSLLEVTNGALFRDDCGYFTCIRSNLAYLPKDVRLKKLAGELLRMGQAGQYNYPRCVSRKDTAAAQLSVVEFVQSAIHAIFLLNQTYMPYYKWQFCALKRLPMLSELAGDLENLISVGNTEADAVHKQDTVERICLAVADTLRQQDLTDYCGNEAEGHAYSVNHHISDPEIRNLHILYAV